MSVSVGEGASTGPAPAADAAGCEVGEDSVEELSGGIVRKRNVCLEVLLLLIDMPSQAAINWRKVKEDCKDLTFV